MTNQPTVQATTHTQKTGMSIGFKIYGLSVLFSVYFVWLPVPVYGR
ncbi:MAG: hypothetical protein JKY10_06190 [Cohaesibacteraceae bacterium]|nr:hypothetical protein [Cohaesibacteraceae bacterium]